MRFKMAQAKAAMKRKGKKTMKGLSKSRGVWKRFWNRYCAM